jgi:hypothetical protein
LQNAIRQQDGTTTASLIERIADMVNKIGARRPAAFGARRLRRHFANEDMASREQAAAGP